MMKKKRKVLITDVYRVFFSGSRKPALIKASSFGEAASIGFQLCMQDEVDTTVMSVVWLDALVELK